MLLWGVHFLILRGVRQAAALNTVATAAKIVPLAVFIVVAIAAFQSEVFELNFWGGETPGLASVSSQVRNTMLVTVFVFVGIEGASVYSRYARKRDDVGVATVLGFLGVLCLLMLVTLLSYGILLRPDLAALRNPSMAGVMQAIVGPWGAVFISVGLIVAVLGNFLSWSLLAAEVLHSAAQNDTMPAVLARENANQVPSAALWLTNAVVQAFLIVSWFAEHAFTLVLKMTGSMVLIPYLLVAAYGVQLAWRGETYAAQPSERRLDLVRGSDRGAVCRGDDLRRGCEVPPALGADLCARDPLVHCCAARAEQGRVHVCGALCVRGCSGRCGRGSLQSPVGRHFGLS